MRAFKNIGSIAVIAMMLALTGFASAKADSSPVGPGPIIQNGNYIGQYVTGTDGSKHFRGFEVADPQSLLGPGTPSTPLFPHSCVDQQGRERSERPCKGN